jgi:DNA polymerase III subunit delta'
MSFLKQSKLKLLGNDQVWQHLVNDYLTGRLSHAYIFAGIEGVGKALMAKELIKYMINADEYIAERIDENNFLDLLVITKEEKTEIGIDKIRNLTDFLSHTPSESAFKFVIIDSADDLNRNAANALLKILEEPTKNTYIFLISHKPYSLLPTIRSRARMIKFKPLDKHDMQLATNLGELVNFEDFVAGSVSRANINQKINFPKLYDQILDLIFNKDMLEFNQFCNEHLKNELSWNVVKECIGIIFLQIAKNYDSIAQQDADERLKKISLNDSLEDILYKYDQFNSLIKQADVFNLDKRQVIFQVINSL